MFHVRTKKYSVTGYVQFHSNPNKQELFTCEVRVESTIYEASNRDAAVGAWLDCAATYGREQGTPYKVTELFEVAK